MAIDKIKDNVKAMIKRKSAYSLPDNPIEKGYKADDIRKAFYTPIIDDNNSVVGEINRIVEETNKEIDKVLQKLLSCATLVGGKIPASQLPSYVDDVVEYDTLSKFPTVGESGKIYVDKSTNYTYRWGGSNYIQIGGNPFDSNLGLTQGDTLYSIVQKRIKSDGSVVATKAYQRGSMSIGGNTVAGDKDGLQTDYSFAFAANENNEAIVRSSAAFGRYNKTFNPGEFVCGNYADILNRSPETVFLVGGGTSSDNRHNAFEVRTSHSGGANYSSAFIGGKAVATQEYVSNNAVKKEGTSYVAYINEGDGKSAVMPYRFSKQSILDAEYTLMLQPMYNGRLYGREPIENEHYATKRYADTKLEKPSNPTETSVITLTSVGTIGAKTVSSFVDTTSEQKITGLKKWYGTYGAAGSEKSVSVNSDGITIFNKYSGSDNDYTKVTFEKGCIHIFGKGNYAGERKILFPYNGNYGSSGGVYFIGLLPYNRPTADSVVSYDINGVPTWKKLSEIGFSINLGNGEGQGSLVQKNVKSSSGSDYTNIASGSAAVAFGKSTKALGNTDFVIGQNNTDDTSGSFVGGINCNNTDNSGYSFVFGDSINNQYASKSFVFGSDIQNSAGNSVIIGSDIVNPVKNTFLIGRGLRPQDYVPQDSESGIMILGTYNKRVTQSEISDGTRFILGNGTSDNARSNALKLSDVKGLESFIEPKTDYGIVRKLELKTKLDKPLNPDDSSVVILTNTGTVVTKALSEFAVTTTLPVTIPWSNLKTSGGIVDQVRTVISGVYEHSLYLRFIYNGWNAEVFVTLLSNTNTEVSDYSGITNILGTTFYHEASGIITNPVGGENEYAVGHIQNISHNGLKVLIPN